MAMNIIVITVDSLRYDYIFSEEIDENFPSIDRICNGGTVFDCAFSNAPYTADSFRSILSGTYPWRFGTTPEGFESERPHIIEPFRSAGYATCGIYANPYLGPSFDYDRGWDLYHSGDDDSESLFTDMREHFVHSVDRESKMFSAAKWMHRTIGERMGIELEGRPYPSAESVSNYFLEWLSSNSERPVFGWVHYMDAHSPFYPHDGTVSEDISERTALSTFYSANKRPTEVTKAEQKRMEQLYLGEIQYLDDQLGTLLDGIEESLDMSETTIVFTSDHGEAFNEHSFCFHPKELYDELVHIPLAIRSPELSVDRVNTAVSNVDIASTVMDAADVEPTSPRSGRSLLTIQPNSQERHVFAHAYESSGLKAMVTDGRWKLIRSVSTGSETLYDRVSDSREQIDLVDEKPDIATTLRGHLDDHLAKMDLKGATDRGTSQEVPDGVANQLEQLGYK